MDPATCVTTCRQQRYRYAGVQVYFSKYHYLIYNGFFLETGKIQDAKSIFLKLYQSFYRNISNNL